MNKETYDRSRALITKYLTLQLRNLRPTALKGRFIGPKVLMNSIPKAGANLLEGARAVSISTSIRPSHVAWLGCGQFFYFKSSSALNGEGNTWPLAGASGIDGGFC